MTPRRLAWGAVALVLLATGVWLFNAGGARLKPALQAATQQATSTTAAVHIEGQRARNVARVRQAEKEAIHAVDEAEDLDAVLAEHDAGIDRVRAEGHGAVDRTDDR